MKNSTLFLNLLAFIVIASTTPLAAAPDLIVTSVRYRTASVAPGGEVAFLSRVKNIGNSKAAASFTRFYLSKNTVIDARDIRLADSLQQRELGPGKPGKEVTIALKVPANCPTGSYYLIAEADGRKQMEELSEENNTLATTTKVKVGPPVRVGFARIPAGSFQMGDSFGEGWLGELPVHTVDVSAFYMAKYETTKELWDYVRAWGLKNGYTNLAEGNNGYYSKGPNHPVHEISWYDILKWCNARSQMDGLTPCYTVNGAIYKTGREDSVACNFAANGYRLPTEAEWEKAARGGLGGNRFPLGNTISHKIANFENSGVESYQSGTTDFHPRYDVGWYTYSSPVGSFAPNGYGLYDMTGNMWERCWDWYGSYSADVQTNPRGPISGSFRVSRGGSWHSDEYNCRIAMRYESPSSERENIGFRVVRSSVP